MNENTGSLFNLPPLKQENGILFFSAEDSAFETQYIRLRKKEGWLYDTTAIKKLPDTDRTDKNYKLWKIRKKSSEMFLRYIKNNQNIYTVLDTGCGSGWFTNKIAAINSALTVIGLDKNKTELMLAANTFSKNNLQWIYADIYANLFKRESFDIILLNASVQYFADISALINILLGYLKNKGEIHIRDTAFYSEADVVKAKKSTEAYYQKNNAQEMIPYYFHHTWNDIKQYNYTILYKPSLMNKLKSKILLRPFIPFPWVVIKK